MKQKTKRFRGGGISSDLASLALVGGLGYMWGRGSKNKDAKDKTAAKDAVIENLKPKEEVKKDYTDAERARAEDYMVGGDPNYKFGDKADSDKKDSSKAKAKPAKARPRADVTSKPADSSSNSSLATAKYPSSSRTPAYGQSPDAAGTSRKAPITSKPNDQRPSKPYPKDAKPKDPDISTSGFGPKNTFLTKSNLDTAQKSMKGGWNKGLFERGDLGLGKRGPTPKEQAEARIKKEKDEQEAKAAKQGYGIKKGGAIKAYASGGKVSASRRADGIAQRGKTRGKVC